MKIAVAVANGGDQVPCRIKLVEFDSKGDPRRAEMLVDKVASRKRLIGCMCGFFSGETIAIGDGVSAAGIPFSGSATAQTVASEGFDTWFRGVAPDATQAKMVALYLREGLDARRVVTVHDRFAYARDLGRGVAKHLRGVNKKTISTDGSKASLKGAAKKIKKLSPDAVFFGGFTTEAARLARHLQIAKVKARFVSDDGAKDPSFDDIAKNAAEGVQVSCACGDAAQLESAQAFVDLHWKKYGTDPVLFAGDLYDMTSFMLEATKRFDGRTSTTKIHRTIVRSLQRARGLEGVMKRYSWTGHGELRPEPGAIWMYEWDAPDNDFAALGRVSELVK